MNVTSLDIYTLALSDVHGAGMRLSDVHDGPLIVSLAARDNAADAEAFGQALFEELGEPPLPVVRIAYLKNVPRPFHAIARSLIRRHQSEGRGLFLDWKGSFHAALHLDPRVANVLVISGSGDVRGPVTGAPTAESLARFRELLSRELQTPA